MAPGPGTGDCFEGVAMENRRELLKNPDKVYVETIVSFDLTGKIRPYKIRWESGEVFFIDRVKEVRTAASTKAGGFGVRYTVVINGRETYLFHELMSGAHECGRWFVEARGNRA